MNGIGAMKKLLTLQPIPPSKKMKVCIFAQLVERQNRPTQMSVWLVQKVKLAISLDSSILGIEGTAEFIIDFARKAGLID